MKIGLSQQCITPAFPVHLGGFSIERISNQKLDDLYVKVMVVEKDGEYFGVFTFDLLAVDDLIVKPIRTEIQKRNINEENFLFVATHTHSGPGGILETRRGLLCASEEIFIKTHTELIDKIIDKSILSFDDAMKDCRDTLLYYAKDVLENVGDNRNNRELKGNNDLSVLFMEQVEGKKAVLLNFACHPTVLNGTNLKVSADFPGAIQTALKADGYDMSFYLNGSCGDISTRFSRHSSDENEIYRYGKLFKQKVMDMRGNARRMDIDTIRFFQTKIRLHLKKTEGIELAQKQLNTCMQNLNDAKMKGITGSDLRLIESYKEGAEANLRLAKYPFDSDEVDVNIQFIKINSHVVICIPGELFSELSNPLQNENVHFVGYANGYLGYFTDKVAYDSFCYEALSSPFDKGEGERMMIFIAQLTDKLLKEE